MSRSVFDRLLRTRLLFWRAFDGDGVYCGVGGSSDDQLIPQQTDYSNFEGGKSWQREKLSEKAAGTSDPSPSPESEQGQPWRVGDKTSGARRIGAKRKSSTINAARKPPIHPRPGNKKKYLEIK